MATDKNKIVENYCLNELKYANSDDSEIWIATHKILKKNFTLKRIKYRASNHEPKRPQGVLQDRQEWCYQNIIRQTELLKKIETQGSPKCHKMIKTSNNIYLVYDQFPGSPLNTHLAVNTLSLTEKLKIILEITKLTNFFHLRGIVFLNLSVYNIYVYNKNSVFFSDWSLARNADNQQRIDPAFITKVEGMARQLVEEGKYYRLSDIYSLGVIFKNIIDSKNSQDMLQKDLKMSDLINQMIDDKVSERPALRQILRVIENCLASSIKAQSTPNIKIKYLESVKTSGNRMVKSRKQLQVNTDIKQKASSSNFNQGSPLLSVSGKGRLGMSKNASSKSITMQSIRSFNTQISIQQSENESNRGKKQKLNCISSARDSNKKKITTFELAKLINKKRNLAFFLTDLSQFVVRLWVCPQAGYLLLKCAYLTVNQSVQQCQSFQLQSDELKKLLLCIQQQQAFLLKNLGLLKQILIMSNIKGSSFFKYELQQEKTVSERQLKSRVIQFSKQMVLLCQKQASIKKQPSNVLEYLFKTLMILKIIEEGSYQKFWEKIYQTDCAFLSSQSYFQRQKNLGIRSLRSQIAQILRK